jgi:hypothetical protein
MSKICFIPCTNSFFYFLFYCIILFSIVLFVYTIVSRYLNDCTFQISISPKSTICSFTWFLEHFIYFVLYTLTLEVSAVIHGALSSYFRFSEMHLFMGKRYRLPNNLKWEGSNTPNIFWLSSSDKIPTDVTSCEIWTFMLKSKFSMHNIHRVNPSLW